MSETIGTRIATYRKRKGLTQAQLAGLVGRSESWLSQVERGLRPVDRLSVLQSVAELLGVSVTDLTGRSAPARTRATVPAMLDGLRCALTRYGRLAMDPARTLPMKQVHATVVQAHRAYQATRYRQVAALLPDVLNAVEAYDPSSPSVQLLRTSAYVVAAKLLTKVGDAELAWLAADRAATAASAAESVAAEGAAAYQVSCALLRNGHTADAERVAVSAAERLTARITVDAPDVLSLAGALWLGGAFTAAQHANRADATRRLNHAANLAGRLGADANYAWTAFGPTNVALHRISVAAKMGDPAQVIRDAAVVDTDALAPSLNGRRAQLHLDVAWAQAQRRHDADAVFHLRQVERIAPELLRCYASAHALLRSLLRRERRGQTPALRPLAARAGVL